MSTALAPAYPISFSQRHSRLPLVQWTCLAGILIAELVFLTLRFDTESLQKEPGLWAVWLGQSHQVVRLAVVIGAATLILGGRQLYKELISHSATLGRFGSVFPFLLVHLAAFAAFVPLTGFVMEGGAAASGHPEIWAAAWASLGLVVVAFWTAAVLPPILWLPLLKRTAGLWALGTLVGAAAWLASRWTGELWRPFREATFWLARDLLSLSRADLVCEPAEALLGTSRFTVQIAPECSGYEGMGLIAVFLCGYLLLFRRRLRFPVALALLPIGVAAMWLLNVFRIVALILIGSWYSPEVARGGFHSQAGWLAFNAVALGLVACSGRLRFLQVDVPAVRSQPTATAAYLAPFCIILAVTMLTRALSAGFDWLYPLRLLAAVSVLWFYRHQYDCLRGSGSLWGIGLGIGAFVFWLVLLPSVANPETDAATSNALAAVPPVVAAGWIVFRLLGAVVMVPLAEELAFRGYLLRRLMATDFERVDVRRFSWLAILASSALFGVLHASWLAGMVVGLIYALAYCRRGRLIDAVLAHGTTNTLLAGYVIATGRWSAWG